jgi:hypothetical protein
MSFENIEYYYRGSFYLKLYFLNGFWTTERTNFNGKLIQQKFDSFKIAQKTLSLSNYIVYRILVL